MPIFDQGYQHWTGRLSGHAWRWLAVTRQGVRSQLQGKFLRLLLFGAWVPALALVAAMATWGLLEQQAESVIRFLRQLLPADVISQPAEYRSAVWTIAYSFFFKAELSCALFLVLIVGPNLISRDLRFNALPLYLSRPLRRIDYFLGKLGVIGFYLMATLVAPTLVAYLFGVAFSLDVSVVRDTHRLLWAGLAYGLIVTLSAGTLMLALSSLSRRTIYVGLAWAGFCFITMSVSGIMTGIRYETQREEMVDEALTKWVKAHPPPAGVEMFGNSPSWQFRPGRPGYVKLDESGKRWFRDWADARGQARDVADNLRAEQSKRDWRPVLSYAADLDRMADWLLNTDAAWVTIGKAVERPRAAFGPIAALHAPPQVRKELLGAANDRLLADRLAWQHPWQWSAAALGGLFLLSVWVLTRRVKSLDRLK